MSKRDRWFPFLEARRNPGMRLFCLPPSGGGAVLFRDWPGRLPEHIEVRAVQLPGRGARVGEKAFDRMNGLVDALSMAVAPYLDVPFAIFGHSMGGLVGFELARQLRRAAAAVPVHLFVSATPAPHHRDPYSHHLLPDRELIAELGKMGGFPPEVLNNRDLMQVLLPTIRADAAVTETYEHVSGEPLKCPITALIGNRDHHIARDNISGWRDYTLLEFQQVECVGGHDFLMTDTARVTETVSRTLTQL